MEDLRLARHKQFGASSEKSEDTLMEQLSFLFNEAEVFSAADKEETENVTVVAAHKRHKKHEYTLDSIPEDQPGRGAKNPKEFLTGYKGIFIQTAMLDTTIREKISRLWDAGLMPGESATRQ